jgi:hypothetical protein
LVALGTLEELRARAAASDGAAPASLEAVFLEIVNGTADGR